MKKVVILFILGILLAGLGFTGFSSALIEDLGCDDCLDLMSAGGEAVVQLSGVDFKVGEKIILENGACIDTGHGDGACSITVVSLNLENNKNYVLPLRTHSCDGNDNLASGGWGNVRGDMKGYVIEDGITIRYEDIPGAGGGIREYTSDLVISLDMWHDAENKKMRWDLMIYTPSSGSGYAGTTSLSPNNLFVVFSGSDLQNHLILDEQCSFPTIPNYFSESRLIPFSGWWDTVALSSGGTAYISGTEATCGDGVVEGDEECDESDGNSERGSCNDECKETFCGDGIVQTLNGREEMFEECDGAVPLGYKCIGCELKGDSDGDGILNEEDNCPQTPNSQYQGTCVKVESISGNSLRFTEGPLTNPEGKKYCTALEAGGVCPEGFICYGGDGEGKGRGESYQRDKRKPAGNGIGDVCEDNCVNAVVLFHPGDISDEKKYSLIDEKIIEEVERARRIMGYTTTNDRGEKIRRCIASDDSSETSQETRGNVVCHTPLTGVQYDINGSESFEECAGEVWGNWYPGTFLLDLGASGGLMGFIRNHIQENYVGGVDDRRWGGIGGSYVDKWIKDHYTVFTFGWSAGGSRAVREVVKISDQVRASDKRGVTLGMFRFDPTGSGSHEGEVIPSEVPYHVSVFSNYNTIWAGTASGGREILIDLKRDSDLGEKFASIGHWGVSHPAVKIIMESYIDCLAQGTAASKYSSGPGQLDQFYCRNKIIKALREYDSGGWDAARKLLRGQRGTRLELGAASANGKISPEQSEAILRQANNDLVAASDVGSKPGDRNEAIISEDVAEEFTEDTDGDQVPDVRISSVNQKENVPESYDVCPTIPDGGHTYNYRNGHDWKYPLTMDDLPSEDINLFCFYYPDTEALEGNDQAMKIQNEVEGYTCAEFQGDRDNDSVGDLCDNCPSDVNNQADTDGDGFGDACDNCVKIPNTNFLGYCRAKDVNNPSNDKIHLDKLCKKKEDCIGDLGGRTGWSCINSLNADGSQPEVPAEVKKYC
ncbi:hypothetical protein HN630_02650 [archaeon]|jgi:hypothetical protein|nr:hypothetical protein [archaeon]MBT3577978.1 hypothetical protein [archaeon]MBT6956516.1 hypothetical protein [archaeon]MBT7025832.1 hypothetical protein [archaeon]MBT7238899.1 hypothetical protein [archaeon]